MDKKLHIGEIIRYERKRQHLSQEELAMNICTREYIVLIENGKYSPSFYIIDLLSKKLKCNLFNLYSELNRHCDIKTHDLIVSINEQLAYQDTNSLENSILLCESQDSFKTGEPFQFLCYIKAIYNSNAKLNYELAITYAEKGLAFHYKSFDIAIISKGTYTNIELMLINCIAVNYCRNENYKEGFQIFNNLLDYLDPFVHSPIYSIHKNLHFEIQLYLLTVYNVSSFKIALSEYDNLLFLIDNAISLLKKLQFTIYLFELLCNKFTILYQTQYYTEAQKCYEQTLQIGTYFTEQNKLDSFIKMVEKLTPQVIKPQTTPET